MTGLPAHEVKIEVSESASTGYECIKGINSFTLNSDRVSLDTTDFCDDSGARQKLMGLKNFTISMSGHFLSNTEQNLIRALSDTGAAADTLFFRILYDGTNGVQLEGNVSTYDISGELEGTLETSIEIEGVGTITAVP